EAHAAVHDVLEADAALYNDERAGFGRGERRCGQDDLVIDAFAELSALACGQERQTYAIAERDERLSDLGLEENDDQDGQVEEEAAQDVFERGEVIAEGEPVEQREGSETG